MTVQSPLSLEEKGAGGGPVKDLFYKKKRTNKQDPGSPNLNIIVKVYLSEGILKGYEDLAVEERCLSSSLVK